MTKEETQEQPFTIDQFYSFCEKGKLMASKCRDCGKTILPPRPLCPHCYSDNLEWTELKGEGTIVTYTAIHVAPPEFEDLVPYIIGVVKLDEGLPFIGMIKTDNFDEVKVGTRVSIACKVGMKETWPSRPRIVFNIIS
ncbi:MAG: Zn-ribbon domain-containing OB-fold protein [Promethearchaeota archaeon]